MKESSTGFTGCEKPPNLVILSEESLFGLRPGKIEEREILRFAQNDNFSIVSQPHQSVGFRTILAETQRHQPTGERYLLCTRAPTRNHGV